VTQYDILSPAVLLVLFWPLLFEQFELIDKKPARIKTHVKNL
jgi:hypothetical protein